MYPQLLIDHGKIIKNVRRMIQLCADHNIEITGVTKVFCGDRRIASTYLRGGLTRLGDSRVANLRKLEGLPCEKWLIRMPMLHEAAETVRYADVSLNSELETLRALNDAAAAQNTVHKVVLMYDLGDLREGFCDPDELRKAAEWTRSAPGLELIGVGTNLTCFSFVHPDTEKLTLLRDAARDIGAAACISGGNSATLDLMLRGGIPEGVNLLRLGESLLFGRERAHYRYLDGTSNDAFLLEAEVIEVKDKPTLPWGEIGRDSYGNTPVFTDRGIRRKAICALGKQDTDVETMWPVDPGVEILGASSDHLMLDITDCETPYRVGDAVRFRLGYFALMRASTSPYVSKIHLNMDSEA